MPGFEYGYRLDTELSALRRHAQLRGIPARDSDHLLIATWNVANLGTQQRCEKDFRVLAEIISWFDIIALQETNDNLEGLNALQAALPDRYRRVFSEASGNQERGAFIYDHTKVQLLEKIDRLSISPSQLARIKLPGTETPFAGFDRGPYLASFGAGSFRCLLVNAHLFYGSESKRDIQRRSLEAYAIAWWADTRRKSRHAYTKDIIALDAFNLPRLNPEDPISKALTSRGLVLQKPELREHLSVVGGSSLQGHKHYDQVAFFPEHTTELIQTDVFDFDNALFQGLGTTRSAPSASPSTTPAISSPTTGHCGRRSSVPDYSVKSDPLGLA